MEFDTNDGLFLLCARTDINLKEIEEYIDEHKLSPERITYVATSLVEKYAFEDRDFEWMNKREPMPHELVSTGWVELFDLFISKGLDPNLIFREGEGAWYNVMDAFFHVRNASIVLPILKKLLDIGGDPNLLFDDETFFDRVDFDIVFGAVEQEDREFYETWVFFWLLLLGYGGRLTNGHEPIEMKNCYTYDVFKDYERFDFDLEFVDHDWFLHVYLKDSGQEVGVL
jgi:hypothetical protein